MLLDKNKNNEFIDDLKKVFSALNFKIIVSVIDKKTHIEEYGKTADDPYGLSLNFIVERYVFCSESEMRESVVLIEKRGAREDQQLLERWVKIYQRGTGYIESSEIQKKIKELKMYRKTANITGLQIADIAASSILRKFIHPKKYEDLFVVLKPKILMYKGKSMGAGVKVFPSHSPYIKTISSLV